MSALRKRSMSDFKHSGKRYWHHEPKPLVTARVWLFVFGVANGLVSAFADGAARHLDGLIFLAVLVVLIATRKDE